MNKPVSSGVVAAVLLVVALAVAGAWSMKSKKDKQEALDRRAIILKGAGGENPAPSPP